MAAISTHIKVCLFFLVAIACVSVAKADLASGKGVKVKTPLHKKIRENSHELISGVKTPLKKIQNCPNGQCDQYGQYGQVRPQSPIQKDPLDGSQLPDDLFGGTPDGRGGSGGYSGGAGNTKFLLK